METVITVNKQFTEDDFLTEGSLPSWNEFASPPSSISICMLGLTFDSPNLGVQALLDGAIRGFLRAHPTARLSVLDYGYESFTRQFNSATRSSDIEFVNLRFSKKIYLTNNIAYLFLVAALLRYLAPAKLRHSVIKRNKTLRHLAEVDVVASIAGGDSFSDIYGLSRLMYVALPQLLALIMGKKLILLPQTLGPFGGRAARLLARFIMRRATVIYSRDEAGLEAAHRLLGEVLPEKVRFCPDVGFLVEPVRPHTSEIDELIPIQAPDGDGLIGLNISGLLYAGGYTRKNMFGLKVGYQEIIEKVLLFLIKNTTARILLIPHVYAEPTVDSLESDQAACDRVYRELPEKLRDRLSIVRGKYNSNEIKYVIGKCDLFIGSRMHACIAALSQGVPAVAISYSDKFAGVMKTIGASTLVADPRQMSLEEVVRVIRHTFEHRKALRRELLETMPSLQNSIVARLQEITCAQEPQ